MIFLGDIDILQKVMGHLKRQYRLVKTATLFLMALACTANAQDMEALRASVKYNNLYSDGDVGALRQAIAEDPSFYTRSDTTFDIRLSTSLLNRALGAYKVSMEMVEVLWGAGAELDPLAESPYGGRVPGALYNAYYGASQTHPRLERQRTLPHMQGLFVQGVSTTEERIELLDFLISNGADVNASVYSYHILTSASQAGPAYVDHLLSSGADPTLLMENGKTFADYIDHQINVHLNYISVLKSETSE